MASAIGGGIFLIVVIALVIVYMKTRATQGDKPPPASESAHTYDANSGVDPVPRDADGMPMVEPADDPAAESLDEQQREARRRDGEPG